MSTQKATNTKAMNRALATILTLALALGLLPIVVLAEEVEYHTQGNGVVVYLDTSDDVVTEDSVTDYYYNIIKTQKIADQEMVFKIAFGRAPGINHSEDILKGGKLKFYTSDTFTDPFYTVPDSCIVGKGNSAWPEAGFAAGRNGTTSTVTIPANTFAPDTTYYMVVPNVEWSGTQGDGSIGKPVVFRFTTAPAGTVAHVCTAFEHHDAKAADKCTDGYQEYWQCTDPDCGKMYSDAEGKNEITRPVPIAAPHNFEVVTYKDATCTEMGYNVVGGNGYNHCLDCGRYFKNNGAEIPKAEVEIPALGHNFVDGVCTRCGETESGEVPLTVTKLESSNGVALTEKTNTTLTATAVGGTAPYTYKFIVYNNDTGAWYKIRDFASDNTCSWYSGAAGSKTLYVDVKDAEGTVVRKELPVTVQQKTVEELLVTSFESSKGTSLTANTETTLRATATGGVAPYTYKFIVYNTETNQWFKIRDFASASTCTWYSGAAASKVLYVDVKDSTGKVVRRELPVTVTAATTPLAASYFTSSKGTSLNANDTTNLVAKATGGSGSGYTYKFIVYNKGTGAWYKIQDYSTKSSCSWYTGAAGNKTLYVDIKDSAGNYVRTPLDVTVK